MLENPRELEMRETDAIRPPLTICCGSGTGTIGELNVSTDIFALCNFLNSRRLEATLLDIKHFFNTADSQLLMNHHRHLEPWYTQIHI